MNKKSLNVGKSAISTYLLPFVAVCSLSACVTYPTVGLEPASTPPRLVSNPVDKSISWDKPSAFGPVPKNLEAKGNEICGTLNTNNAQYKAIGYHQNAEGLDGKALPAGGYFCVQK